MRAAKPKSNAATVRPGAGVRRSGPNATRRRRPDADVDAYIRAFPRPVQDVLNEIRRVARAAAPDADEVISYRMPALKWNGIVVSPKRTKPTR